MLLGLLSCVVAAQTGSPSAAEETPGAQGCAGEVIADREAPARFIHVNAIGIGLNVGVPCYGEVMRVDYEVGRLRAGAALGAVYWNFPNKAGVAFLPLHGALEIYSHPWKNAFYSGRMPDVRVEAMVAFITGNWSPMARLSVIGEMDYYGVGIGLEAGVATASVEGLFGSPDPGRISDVFAGLRLNALTARFEL